MFARTGHLLILFFESFFLSLSIFSLTPSPIRYYIPLSHDTLIVVYFINICTNLTMVGVPKSTGCAICRRRKIKVCILHFISCSPGDVQVQVAACSREWHVLTYCSVMRAGRHASTARKTANAAQENLCAIASYLLHHLLVSMDKLLNLVRTIFVAVLVSYSMAT